MASEPSAPLHLFEGYGIELEYMIVDRDTLDVRPICDRVMAAVSESGEPESEVSVGEGLAWSNELVLHVLEMKTDGPVKTLNGLGEKFQRSVRRANEILAAHNAMLMPTAMHPWMDPHTESKLWPHEYNDVYRAFDRIFGCKGHGWSNLQSMHINLPFHGDEEFARLHAAVRAVLPLLPALAASSPFVEGKKTGLLDNRLEFYRKNCVRVPMVTGRVVPEPVYAQADYQREIFERMFADIAPLDPEGTLQKEFLNARGAIARFSRGSIEIRVLDLQECPAADIGLAGLVIALLQWIVESKEDPAVLRNLPTDGLAETLVQSLRSGRQTPLASEDHARALGLTREERTVGEVWSQAFHRTDPNQRRAGTWDETSQFFKKYELGGGSLAERMLQRVEGEVTRDSLAPLYRELCEGLEGGRLF